MRLVGNFMAYIFDTNIIIGFLKNERAIVEKIINEEVINIPVITVGEMLFGANKSDNSEKNLSLYKDFFKCCEIFEITERTSEYYADIKYFLKKSGKPIPENDLWIAAIAKEHDFTLITRDKHFKNIDLIKSEEW